MRKVKITSVRIGDYIATAVYNGTVGGFYGKVESIIHLSPNMIQVNVQEGGCRAFTIDGPAGFTPDQVYRER